MDNTSKNLLWQNFKSTYEEAKLAYQHQDYAIAAGRLRKAADLLVKVANTNPEDLRAKQLAKAEELRKTADSLPNTNATVMPTPTVGSGRNDLGGASYGAGASTVASGSATGEEGQPSFITPITSNITFDDVIGLDDVLDLIRDIIITPLSRSDVYEKYGINAGGAVLMFGPPGTGKTMIAEAISNELKASYFYVKSSTIKNKYVGETEKTLDAIFNEARAHRPAVIFFDEFDDLALKRSEENKVSMAAVPKLLTEIDGVGNTLKDILILAATNIPWDIDTAILSRFEKVYLPLPNAQAREGIFRKKLEKNLAKADNFDCKLFAEKSEKFSGRDIKKICDKVRNTMAKKEIVTGQEQLCTNDVVLQAIEAQRPYVKTVSNVAKFERFLKDTE